jgi:4-aminobutyrate aminotransferase / (S)-3-amino-2-methylpropionate transaminase / 5-aminovalerate transaminase
MLPELKTSIPGPKSRHLLERLKKVENQHITFQSEEFPIVCSKASGCNVWDPDGNRFLDLTSFFGVSSLGHKNPVVMKAIKSQCDSHIHSMGDVHPTESKIRFLEMLQNILPIGLSGTILSSSGAEAVESAIKTMLLHTRKPGLIAFSGGYHGLSMGALSSMDWNFFTHPFQSWRTSHTQFMPYPNCYRCPYDKSHSTCHLYCIEQLEQQIDHMTKKRIELGGILLEPIQGRGGVIPLPEGYLKQLEHLCQQHEILLLLDEIFTGFYRTGYWWACTKEGVVPDILCMGKSIANGVPLSACCGKESVMQSWGKSTGEAIHTSTFLGNPLAMAAGCAVIEELHNLEDTIHSRGKDLQRLLLSISEQADWIGDVRGSGMMWGIECIDPVTDEAKPDGKRAQYIMQQCLKRGILVLTSSKMGQVLSLTPPFVIEPKEMEHAISVIFEVGNAYSKNGSPSSSL